MDRQWMNHNGVKDRQKPEYIAGVNEFLQFAFRGKNDKTMLKCPCLNCRLVLSQDRKNMQCHLLVYGIDRSYNPWVSHGENLEQINNNEEVNIEEGYTGEVSDNENDEMPYDDNVVLLYVNISLGRKGFLLQASWWTSNIYSIYSVQDF